MSKLITVEFNNDTLFALDAPSGVSVALKPIADRLGLDWSAQLRRTKRDPVLCKGMAVMTIPSPGGPQEAACLRLHLLPGWLFGIDVRRVQADAQAAVMVYQEQCHDVLFRHFYGGARQVVEVPVVAREEPVRVRRQLVTEARHVFGERAAGRLWFALGLPVVPEMQDGSPQSEFGFTYTALPTAPSRA